MGASWMARRRAAQRAARFGGVHQALDRLLAAEQPITAAVGDQVGWMVAVDYTVKGVGHICRRCRPEQPTAMVPVYRQQLAAKEPCRMCRRPLEEA